MTGIHYLTDDQGNQVAVQIDLKQHGELWQDVYDSWLAEQRAAEPRDSLVDVKALLAQQNAQ